MTNETNPNDPHGHDAMPEGKEPPPPGVKTMSLVRWAILGGITLFALFVVLTTFNLTPWQQHGEQAVIYHCPMHPTYTSNQPGECPICGMDLVPIDADQAATEKPMTMPDSTPTAHAGQYTCPMHPEVVSDTMGRCPKCNMFLEPVKSTASYTCPMHPDVVSDTPGECPKCGMDLVPMKETESEAQSMAPSHGVPGLTEVMIAPERLQLIGLQTGAAEMRSLEQSSRFAGYVVPDETKLANITVRVKGWVQDLYVNETGQPVAKGATLFTLYSQELYRAEQDYVTSARSMRKANIDPLLADTRQQLLAASKDRLHLLGLSDAAISALEEADTATSILPIVSPFDGVVLEKNILPGQAVMPEQTLFSIADLSRVWVEVEVYEADLANLHVGQDAVMTMPAYPGDEFHGSIAFIYPTLSAATRTLKVRLQFQNPLMRLRPGMFANVQLHSGANEVLAVSREAVMQDGSRSYVYVVRNDNEFEPRRVEIGEKTNDWIEIRSGLHAGETVVTSANFLIDSESRLKSAISGMSNGSPAMQHEHEG